MYRSIHDVVTDGGRNWGAQITFCLELQLTVAEKRNELPGNMVFEMLSADEYNIDLLSRRNIWPLYKAAVSRELTDSNFSTLIVYKNAASFNCKLLYSRISNQWTKLTDKCLCTKPRTFLKSLSN